MESLSPPLAMSPLLALRGPLGLTSTRTRAALIIAFNSLRYYLFQVINCHFEFSHDLPLLAAFEQPVEVH